MRKLQRTEFHIALYTAEPEEHNLSLHELEGYWYWRMKPAIRMCVGESDKLNFSIEFSATWNRLYGCVEYMALLGDGKLIRAKKIGPMVLEPSVIYDFSYVLNMNVIVD